MAQPTQTGDPVTGLAQFDLSGRVAVVTGGSKGLGQSIADGLASAGASVLLASRHAEEVERAAEAIAARHGTEAAGIAADITEPQQVEALFAEVDRRFGHLDVLVNNAGINIRGAIGDLTLEHFRQVQAVNVDGLWLCSRAATVRMRAAGRGSIINLASTLGVVGLAGRTPYAMSKGAVVQMSRTLALELAADGVRVNAICPGPFLTPMNEPIAETDEARDFIVGATALGRWGRMHEIQGAAIFLASEASSYVTGSLLMVDGGWTAS